MKFTVSDQMRTQSHRMIPGGAHTYAKGDDQFPKLSPGFIVRGKGCKVWDVDGNEFIEFGSGLRAVTLGHAYEPIVKAAQREMENGVNFVRPSHLEYQLAEKVLANFPNADMVKFAKHGSDATSAAVKLARAYTGKPLIAICAEHPFFSVDDWFIGSTPMPGGIPGPTRDMTVKFNFNDLPSLQALFKKYPDQIAGVILEAEKDVPPTPEFLQGVRSICDQQGALMILDEVVTAFRWHQHGAQHLFGIKPDLFALGKALANGFSVSGLAGKRQFMEAGGILHDKERVFLLSTTHGGETHGLAAAIATLDVYNQIDVCGKLYESGKRLRAGWQSITRELGMMDYLPVSGRDCNLVFGTRNRDRQPCQLGRALFMQELIKAGILAPSLVVNLAHTPDIIDDVINRIIEPIKTYRKALEDGFEKHLTGGPTKVVFRPRC